MPRDVVPIFRSPRRASDSTSSSRWYGRITCAFSLTSSRPSTDDAQARQLVDFLEQRLRVDDDAVADDARDARMQDARRDEVQHELRAVHVDGVPGVVPALVARHRREMRRQHVDDLALAFVSPLRAEHGDIGLHHSATIVFDALRGQDDRVAMREWRESRRCQQNFFFDNR